jgi:hypothetical protein
MISLSPPGFSVSLAFQVPDTVAWATALDLLVYAWVEVHGDIRHRTSWKRIKLGIGQG